MFFANAWYKIFISALVFVFLSNVIFGVPAWPGVHTLHQPDGTTFNSYQRGDEFGAWFETEDAYIIKQSESDNWWNFVLKSSNDSDSSAPSSNVDLRVGYANPTSVGAIKRKDFLTTPQVSRIKNVIQEELPESKEISYISYTPQNMPSSEFSPEYAPPPTGTHSVLVILVEFTDMTHDPAHTPAYYQNLLFNASNPNSMNSYYREVSYGKLNLTGTVVGWYRSSHSLSYYGADGSGTDNLNGPIYNLTREAVLLANPDVNFANYDKDGDGYVDHVIIIHAGYGQEYSDTSTDIWSHRSTVQPAQFVDVKFVYYYTMNPEYGTMGVFAHEFGHDLGLPDLYNTRSRYSPNEVGFWDLMAYGIWGGPGGDGSVPTHLSAWSKIDLGWLNATQLNGIARSYNVKNIENNNQAFIINNSILSLDKEYFIVENRQAFSIFTFL